MRKRRGEREMVWKETRGTGELVREVMEAEERRRKKVEGMARCVVCNGAARAEVFGAEGRGVWVGCDRSPDCSRYIELHEEGWSLDEVMEEWNRWNGGVYRAIRKLKYWIWRAFSAEKRAERREKRCREAENGEKTARRCEIFGVEMGKRRSFWEKGWLKGNRQPGKTGRKREKR